MEVLRRMGTLRIASPCWVEGAAVEPPAAPVDGVDIFNSSFLCFPGAPINTGEHDSMQPNSIGKLETANDEEVKNKKRALSGN